MTELKKAFIEEIKWKGHDAVKFGAGGYEALIVPGVGANLIELNNTEKDIKILRTPTEDLDFESFKNRPQVFGLPVLFPPNRIEDGKFTIDGREYQLPINEPARNNYIHGFIKNDEWHIVKKEVVSDDVVEIEAAFDFTKEHEFYKYLPHEFQFKLSYTLSSEGLKQVTSVVNLSDSRMPVGVGYHSAFNVPFKADGNESDYTLVASVEDRWEQDARNLSTGKSFALNDEEAKYLTDGVAVLSHPIESQYALKKINVDGNEFKGAIIVDKATGSRVFYEMGDKYKYLTIWNDNGDKKYVCIEPQSWIVNAPNVDLSPEVSGFRTIDPNEMWSEEVKIYAK